MRMISMVIILFMAGCQNGSISDTKQPGSAAQLVGADKDEHGCIGSAGYTWSIVKDSCIRFFKRLLFL